MASFSKYTADRRLFSVDFNLLEEMETEAITSATWTSVPTTGITIGAPQVSAPGIVSAWISAGTIGVEYVTTCTATTDAGAVIVGEPSILILS